MTSQKYLFMSEAKLEPYKKNLFNFTEEDQIASYFTFDLFSSYFASLANLLEILFRNSFHNILNTKYGLNWDNDIISSSTLGQKTKNHILNARLQIKTKKHPNINDLIAELPLGFWVYLVDNDKNDTKEFIWSDQVKETIFPYAKNFKNEFFETKIIFEQLQIILKIRNRLYHCEPLWKGGSGISRNEDEAITRAIKYLKKRLQHLIKVIRWISGEEFNFLIKEKEELLNECCNINNIKNKKLYYLSLLKPSTTVGL